MSVYTPLTPQEAAQHLANYDLGPLTALEGISEGVVNSNFRLSTPTARYVLTLAEEDGPSLPWVAETLLYLAERGYPCPRPQADRQGRLILPVKGRPAILCTHLSGSWPQQPTPAQCRASGEILARLHRLGGERPVSRKNPMGPARLDEIFSRLRPVLPHGERRTLLEEELARGHPAAELPGGLCHCDLFPDNTLFTGDALSGVLDFFYAGHEIYLYDLAVALNAWGFDGAGVYQEAHFAALLAGYAAIRPLSAAEGQALPHALRRAALRFALTRLLAATFPKPGARVTRKDPEPFFKRLRHHRGQPSC